MEMVQTRYGDLARDIIKDLLLFGHATIENLMRAHDSNQNLTDVPVNGNGNAGSLPNGMKNGYDGYTEGSASGALQTVLLRLLEAGFVQPVIPRMFQSPSDTYNEIESEVIRESFVGGTKGTKQKEEFKAKVVEKLRDLRSESQGWQSSKGAKRALNGGHTNGNEKRRKLVNGHSSVNGESHTQDSEINTLDVGFSSFASWP